MCLVKQFVGIWYDKKIITWPFFLYHPSTHIMIWGSHDDTGRHEKGYVLACIYHLQGFIRHSILLVIPLHSCFDILEFIRLFFYFVDCICEINKNYIPDSCRENSLYSFHYFFQILFTQYFNIYSRRLENGMFTRTLTWYYTLNLCIYRKLFPTETVMILIKLSSVKYFLSCC
jgi:hypothetical protein